MKSWQKSNYVSLFGLIYSYFAPIYHFGLDLALFIYIFQYLALLNYIYPHLVIFIPLIALIWPYMPYSPYIYRYSASETAPLRTIERLYDFILCVSNQL